MVRGTRAGSFAPSIMKRFLYLLPLLLGACGGSGEPAPSTDHTADPGEDPRGAPDLVPLWSFLDLTPEGRAPDWYPKLSYDD